MLEKLSKLVVAVSIHLSAEKGLALKDFNQITGMFASFNPPFGGEGFSTYQKYVESVEVFAVSIHLSAEKGLALKTVVDETPLTSGFNPPFGGEGFSTYTHIVN